MDIAEKKGPERRRSGPFLVDKDLETITERADDLVPVDAGLIVRIAIFGPEIGMVAKPELDAGAGADAVEVAMIGEVERRAARPVVIFDPAARIGIARLGVDQGARADQGADPAADIEVGRSPAQVRSPAMTVPSTQRSAELSVASPSIPNKARPACTS